MPTLLEVQRAMSRNLIGMAAARSSGGLAQDTDAAPLPGLRRPAEPRLSIYRNTCRGTLLNALGLSYPAVQRLVGSEFFASAAEHFIDEHVCGVPESACLSEYGREFGPFLRSFTPAAGLCYLPDVAALEWAVNEVLHAPEAARLEATQLASRIGGDPEVRFVPHPSIRLLSLRYPADLIWRGALDHDDATLASVDLASGPIWLLVERADAGLQVHRLAEQAWRFTERLCAGVPLCAALDLLPEDFAGTTAGPESQLTAADVLALHLSAGRFIDALPT